MSTVDVADRVRALRRALSLTQEAVLDAAGGRLDRVSLSAVENGRNRASTHRIRTGLAEGFGVPVETISAYLDGEIDLSELLGRRSAPRQVAPVIVTTLDERYPNRTVAAAALRGVVPDEVIDAALAARFDSADDLTALEWIDLIKGDAVRARLAARDPGASARATDRQARLRAALSEATAPKLPGRSK